MSNTFGTIFKITTFGESHNKAIGVIIDGCPPNIPIYEKEIDEELKKRSTGKTFFTSKRLEKDRVEILSGVFKNKTTGAPISIIIKNKNYNSQSYENIKDLYRPGHSNFTYIQKYGHIDPYGGGRSSARETVARVAASVIAKKILKKENIEILSFIKKIKEVEVDIKNLNFYKIKKHLEKSIIRCPDREKEKEMIKILKKIEKEKDSIGATVQLISTPLPPGLGEPLFEKLSSKLAYAFFSIPAVVGLEIGSGFSSLKGSQNNDLFKIKNQKLSLKTNNSGGILAGISTGMPLDIKIAFKPTPTIGKPQKTFNFKKEKKILKIPKNLTKDICVAIRGTIIVEAMAAITLVDLFLLSKRF